MDIGSAGTCSSIHSLCSMPILERDLGAIAMPLFTLLCDAVKGCMSTLKAGQQSIMRHTLRHMLMWATCTPQSCTHTS